MTTHLIILKTVRYSDRHSILSAYSRESGRVSLLSPAGTGREASRLKALTMPMSLCECEVHPRPGRDVMPMRQLRTLAPLASLRADPLKTMTAMFLAEVLDASLQGSQADEALFDFIDASVRTLDASAPAAAANFHICFLYSLSRHLGIEPDASTFCHGSVLDLADGLWRQSLPLHRDYLDVRDSAVAHAISRMTYANMHRFRFNRQDRHAIIERILDYYAIHLTPRLRQLRSLDILSSLL